jgi:hypothetical protein
MAILLPMNSSIRWTQCISGYSMLPTVGFEAHQVTPNWNASTAHIKPQAHEDHDQKLRERNRVQL